MRSETKRRPWTPGEDAILQANVGVFTMRELGQMLNRHHASVWTRKKLLEKNGAQR